MNATLHHVTRENGAVTTFHFLPQEDFAYEPGQYIELTIVHQNPDNRGITRSFSLSSSPTEQFLAVTTKTDIPRPSTFTKALIALKKGAHVRISRAQGEFLLPREAAIPLVFVARGLGITPFRSMVKWLVDKNDQRNIRFLYDVAGREEIVFQHFFLEAGIQPEISLHASSDPSSITQLCDAVTSAPKNARIYLAGPDKMVTAMRQALVSKGLPRDTIKIDAYITTAGLPSHG